MRKKEIKIVEKWRNEEKRRREMNVKEKIDKKESWRRKSGKR